MTSMISARLSDPHTMWSVLTRASVCRTLANNAEAAYTAGLLSALAEEVGEASESMAIRAGVSFEVSLALSSGVGDLGALIDAVRAYERADIPEVIRHGWDPVDIADAYFRALPTTYEYLKLLHSVSAA
jgi:EAL and modified HD-GYP domain-containing signal transduction protein